MRTVTIRPSDSTTSVGSDSLNRQNQLKGMPQVDARVCTRPSPECARASSMRSWCLSRCSSGMSSCASGPWMPSIRALAASPARSTSWLGQYSSRSGAPESGAPASGLPASRMSPAAVPPEARAGPRDRNDPDQIRRTGGERVPARAGDAAEGGQQFGVFDGRPGNAPGPRRAQGTLLFLREGFQGFVDPQRGGERQPGLAAVEVARHRTTSLPWAAPISRSAPRSRGRGPRRPCPCAPRGRWRRR